MGELGPSGSKEGRYDGGKKWEERTVSPRMTTQEGGELGFIKLSLNIGNIKWITMNMLKNNFNKWK